MDWPLSREETKCRLLRLYDSDVQAADQLLHNGEAALEALRGELNSIRHAKGTTSAPPLRSPCLQAEQSQLPTPSKEEVPEVTSIAGRSVAGDADEATIRLREAVESATAVAAQLKVLMGVVGKIPEPASLDSFEAEAELAEVVAARPRARSEGAERNGPLLSALRPQTRRRRWSRGGKALSVSWADAPKDADVDIGSAEAIDTSQEDRCEPDVARTRWTLGVRSGFWQKLGSAPSSRRPTSGLGSQQHPVMSLESFLNEDVPQFPVACRDAEKLAFA